MFDMFKSVCWPVTVVGHQTERAQGRKGETETSAVAEHVWQKQHQINWKNSSVLSRANAVATSHG